MNETFGERIRSLRKKAGLTQEELADILNLSVMTIIRWEWGERQPRIDEIKALAKALGVTEADLLNDPPLEHSGEWTITFKVADKFTKEEINLAGNIQPIAQITTTPAGCAFTIQADWEMLKTKSGLEKLFKRILKETYPAMRGTGVALGGLSE